MLKSFLQKLFKGNSFLLNLLISVVGIICVPLICIQLFMILRSTNEFEQEATYHYRNALQSLANAFDDQINSLSTIAGQTTLDDDMMEPVRDDTVGYDLWKIAQKVNRNVLDTPFVDNMAIYYTRRDMCLHGSYKRTVQDVCDRYFPAGTEGSRALAAFIQETESLSWINTGNYPDALAVDLLVARSVSDKLSSKKDAVVFFTISEEKLSTWCSVFLPVGTGFSIIAPDGSYMLRSADFTDELLADSGYLTFLNTNSQITYAPKLAQEMVLYKYRDAATGRIFVVSMPADTVEQSISGYTREAAGILIITIVLMVLLLIATLYVNYRPVFRIVEKHIEADKQSNYLSELEMIDSRFFALDERINNQENLLATFTMGDLLSGIQVAREEVERYFMPEVYRSFVAVVSPVTLTTAHTNEICRVFAHRTPGKLIVTTVPYRPETVFVYCCYEALDVEELRKRLQQLLEQLTGEQCSLSFGHVVTDIIQIQSSYNEALPPEKLAVFPEQESPLEGDPQALIQDFVQCICDGQRLQALQVLDKLEPAVQQLKPAAKRFVNQKLLYGYLISLQKSSIVLPESEINQLIAFPNGVLLFKLLRKSVESLKGAEGEQNAAAIGQMESSLLEFVDANYLDSRLCLTAAADHMQTSIYTVSRIFKECTGVGFKEYITGKRLKQACLLLRTTSKNVTTIAQECGFENANYFTVVFRTEYGMPPSKYRSEYGGSDPQ